MSVIPSSSRGSYSAWAISRGALLFVGLLGVAYLRLPSLAAAVTPHAPADPFIERWRAWDTPIYLEIAQHGYTRLADAAYFPLYSLLIRLTMLVGITPLVAALLVSNLAALGAFLGLERLGRSALVALVFYPAAFFLAAAYADSLFLALAVWVVLAVRDERWWLTSGLLLLAGLSRPTAAALFVFVLVEFTRRRAWSRVDACAAVASVPFALAVFAVGCIVVYRDPLAFGHAEASVFGHHLLWPWQSVALTATQIIHASDLATLARILFDVLPVVGVAAVTALAARTQPIAYTCYSCAILLLAICSPVVGPGAFPLAWVSAARYLLACVPAWLALGGWLAKHRIASASYMVLGAIAEALALIFFLQGGWLV